MFLDRGPEEEDGEWQTAVKLLLFSLGEGGGGVRVRAGIIAVERVLKAKGIAGIVGAVGMCVFCGV